MITKYITKLSSTYSPLAGARAHRVPRIILAFLKPDARAATGGNMSVSTTLLPSGSKAPSSLVATFRDGRELKFVEGGQGKDVWDLNILGVDGVVRECDRHSRVLGRKEELNG